MCFSINYIGAIPLLTGFFDSVNLTEIDESIEYEHSAMIDWLSLRIDLMHLPEPVVRKLQSLNSRLFKVSASTGHVEWESFAWESVASDTHQICFRVGSDFYIQGSPARLGLPNNAFGSLCIQYCAKKMISFASSFLGLTELFEEIRSGSIDAENQPTIAGFPPLSFWSCTRIDITRNYLMQSEAEARQALAYLKQSPEGKQRHSYETNGFYIGKRSTLHKGKIYLKGQDAKRNQKSGRAHYTEEQLEKSQLLLRTEYTMARGIIRRFRENHSINWYQLNPDYLLSLHDSYFKDYFSQIEVTDMGTVLEKLLDVAPTEGQGRAAYDCYTRIRLFGYEQAKTSFTKPSWYRHLKLLKLAGFNRSDLQPTNVIPLQKRAIHIACPVRHWDDIQVA